MEKKKRQQVRFEMFSYEGTSTLPFQPTTYNLVFIKPCEITFSCYGPSGLVALINNNIVLSPFTDVLTAVANTPYTITLRTNYNEVDITRYVIKVFTGTVVQALVKFNVDSE